MRILHAMSLTDPAQGGTTEGVRQLAAAMAPHGATLEIVSLDDPDASPWRDEFPAPVHAMGPGQGRFSYAPRMEAWLREHGKEFDVIVVDGLWQFNGLAVWRTRHAHGRPYFVFSHGMLDPWFRRTYPLKHLKKQLYWLLGQRRVLRDAQGLLYTCEEERVQAQGAFAPWGPFKERVTTYGTAGSPFDLDEARGAFLARYPALAATRNLLYLSRIHEKKGCDLLIRAFARHPDPDLRLVMAGPDQTGWKATLEAMARELGVADRIVWTGMIQDEVKWGAYAAAEAFVLPSHQENFGIVVAEALACGVPTLISNKVNIWREIEADGAGIVAEDDQAGTDALLERWLALPDEDKARMRAAARGCFDRRFDADRAARILLEAYASALRPASRTGTRSA